MLVFNMFEFINPREPIELWKGRGQTYRLRPEGLKKESFDQRLWFLLQTFSDVLKINMCILDHFHTLSFHVQDATEDAFFL